MFPLESEKVSKHTDSKPLSFFNVLLMDTIVPQCNAHRKWRSFWQLEYLFYLIVDDSETLWLQEHLKKMFRLSLKFNWLWFSKIAV